MIKDVQAAKTNGKEIIEILITDGKTRVWCPVMATSLFTITKNQDVNKVEAIRVRNLEKEEENFHKNELDICHVCGGYDGCLKGCDCPTCK